MRRLLFLITFLIAFPAFAQLTPDALKLLETLPGKRLSLDTVVRRAMKESDSYRVTLADRQAAEVPLLKAEALTDTILSAKAGWRDDKREPLIVFSPNRTRGTLYSLGVSQYLLTGTAIELELQHGWNNISLPTFGVTEARETKGTLTLAQNLWKDSFGYGSRAGRDAADLTSQSLRSAIDESRETWFLQMAELYYSAWLAQAQYEASRQGLQRRERLMKILGIRFKRGTSEAPEVLQVKSAYQTAKVQEAKALQALYDRWRTLISVLKLPAALESVHPAMVPMDLDKPYDTAQSLCGPLQKPAEAPTSSATVERYRLLKQAADRRVDAARAQMKPQLQLLAELGANAVDPSAGPSFSDFSSVKHPLLSFGIGFRMPLGFSAEDAEYRSALSDQMKGEASYKIATDLFQVDWRNLCFDLARLEQANALYEEAFASQQRREKLQEGRFRLGRTSTFEIIQAGDDATQTELALHSSRIEYRLTAWKLQRMAGTLKKYLGEIEAVK